MRPVLLLGGLAVAGALAGSAVVFLGLYNTSARSGHWPGVSWVLHTTFRNSVELRAPSPEEVPDLTEPMVRLGARHYASACETCHGAPGTMRTATIRAMVPAPPPIAEAVGSWTPAELGWIVREGVKMSGMPGWPSVRNDEVWSVVAFLTRVGSMTHEQYAALVGPASTDGPPGFGYCAGCHGTDGVSGNARIPRLDIQTPDYLEMALLSYRDGRRQSGYMTHAASAVPGERLRALAQRFGRVRPGGEEGATRPAAGPEAPADTPAWDVPLTTLSGSFHGGPEPAAAVATLSEPVAGSAAAAAGEAPRGEAEAAAAVAADPVVRGRALATAEAGLRDVPACQSCHGPDAERRRSDTPALAGQYRAYLEVQLRLWRDGVRGGGPRAPLMTEAAKLLSDAEIVALAAYYASLPPDAP